MRGLQTDLRVTRDLLNKTAIFPTTNSISNLPPSLSSPRKQSTHSHCKKAEIFQCLLFLFRILRCGLSSTRRERSEWEKPDFIVEGSFVSGVFRHGFRFSEIQVLESSISLISRRGLFWEEKLVLKMNDLMTKSFLSYVELKKQAKLDLDAETYTDIELGNAYPTRTREENNLSQFFGEIAVIQTDLEEISNLLIDLQGLNEEAKTTHSAKILRGLRDRMDADMVSVLRKGSIVKARLESLEKSNKANRKISVEFAEGGAVDRTRISTTNGLKVKLKDIMCGFQDLRETILSDYKESLRRRYYTATGEVPSEEVIEKMVSGTGNVEIFGAKTESDLENRERHQVVIDIQRSLNKLHQVFLDMAALVETQGDQIDDIEHNVAKAGSFISGGTQNLYYAKQMKKQNKKWILWVLAVAFIILLVCFVAMLTD